MDPPWVLQSLGFRVSGLGSRGLGSQSNVKTPWGLGFRPTKTYVFLQILLVNPNRGFIGTTRFVGRIWKDQKH